MVPSANSPADSKPGRKPPGRCGRNFLDRAGARLRSYVNLAGSMAAIRLGRVPHPRIAHFLITWQCNQKCLQCTVWKRQWQPELSTSNLKSVIDRLTCLDTIKIFGGEPFLRPDLPELVSHMDMVIRPAMIQLVSNGLLTERILLLAQECGTPTLHLRLSWEGYGETHDRLRGLPGAFDRVMATLEGLVELRARRGFHLGINYSVTEESLPDLPQVLELCRRLKVNLVPGFPYSPFLEHRPTDQRDVQKVRDQEQLRRRLDKIYRGGAGFNPLEGWILKRSSLRAYQRLLAEGKLLAFPCLELRSLLYLMPSGDIVTCGINHTPVGNLLEQSLESIWFGEKMQAFRRAVDTCPGCFQSSVEIMSRVYSGHFF